MLTISDKAFLLLVLVNDAACWSAKVQLETGKPTLRLVILFVASASHTSRAGNANYASRSGGAAPNK